MKKIIRKIKLYVELILFGCIRADAAILDMQYIRFYAEDELIFEIQLC